MSGTVPDPLTGFWLGEGGIDSPSLGVLVPLLLRFCPGIGGLRSGAGEEEGDVMVPLPKFRYRTEGTVEASGTADTYTS